MFSFGPTLYCNYGYDMYERQVLKILQTLLQKYVRYDKKSPPNIVSCDKNNYLNNFNSL
jgi:hypothetical protein